MAFFGCCCGDGYVSLVPPFFSTMAGVQGTEVDFMSPLYWPGQQLFPVSEDPKEKTEAWFCFSGDSSALLKGLQRGCFFFLFS